MKPIPIRIGKRGTMVIPSILREQFKLAEGDLVIAEDYEGGILIRPAIAMPVEHYSLEKQAEFLLSNAVDEADYTKAKEAVRKMGLDPDTIRHYKPKR